MKKRTIYIAGPITADKDNYQERFRKAEDYLKSLGWEVVNPALKEYDDDLYKETGEKDKWTSKAWLFYVKRDMDLVSQCEAIYLLNGWEQSPGATAEYITAKKFNLKVYFEDENVIFNNEIIPIKGSTNAK